MAKPKLNKLSSEVVNQIAAGEVIERPSSVVKELVDNSVDAGATKIVVKIKNGGIDSIEVSDNGIGIPVDNIEKIFEAHTTTKIEKIEDLNTLLSMGFRGEALSTITSVSRVKLLSKHIDEETGTEITYNEDGKSKPRKTAKDSGTTILVENIFYNIPARKKYLKTANTEYRKIYEILSNYFLIYPNIHFLLEKDGKVTKELVNVPNSRAGDMTEERVKAVVGESEYLKLFYNGAGVEIDGYISHPSNHKSRSSNTYIFINNRPITDRGIVRSIYEGYSRYLPFGQKVDFVINIKINPELVDVNVHPRKEEVRFENPFRLYSAIEGAVRHTLEKELSFKADSTAVPSGSSTEGIASLRENYNRKTHKSEGKNYEQNSFFNQKSSASVRDTLDFSRELLSDDNILNTTEREESEHANIRNIFQVFNKYIIIEFEDEKLWIVDQHAAAERVTFEKLSEGVERIEVQNYLVPVELEMTESEILFLEEFRQFFKDIGVEFSNEKGKVFLNTVPVEFEHSDFRKIFDEIFSLEEDLSVLKKNFKKKRDDVLATISCHSSIRSGQRLERVTMLDLYTKLMRCKNPYSCPHGRPAVWKLTLNDIDINFERTY